MIKRVAGGLMAVLAAQMAFAQPPRAAEQMVPARFGCDGISYDGQLDARTLAELEPAHSLEAVAAVLARHKIAFKRNRGILDVPAMPAGMFAAINTLPQGEPFIFPQADRGMICVLVPGAGSV